MNEFEQSLETVKRTRESNQILYQEEIDNKERTKNIALKSRAGTSPEVIFKEHTPFVLDFVNRMNMLSFPGAVNLNLFYEPNNVIPIKNFLGRIVRYELENPNPDQKSVKGYFIGLNDVSDNLWSRHGDDSPIKPVYLCEDSMLRTYSIYEERRSEIVHDMYDLYLTPGKIVRWTEFNTETNRNDNMVKFKRQDIKTVLIDIAEKYS